MPHTGVLRAVTLAQYDHCAVVVEDSDGDLCLLESCVVGVRAFPLVQRVREYAAHYADVIVWRRLVASRTEAATERCREFVTAVDGRKYSYNVAKMVFTLRQAGLPSATTEKQPPAFEDAYYCSELICAFFQHCGLMQLGCRAASFWPQDLGDGGVCERWMEDDAKLAAEIVIHIAPTASAAARPRSQSTPSDAGGGIFNPGAMLQQLGSSIRLSVAAAPTAGEAHGPATSDARATTMDKLGGDSSGSAQGLDRI